MKVARPTLTTPRSVVRLPTSKDIASILVYLEENRTHLAPFDPVWPKDFCSSAFWEQRIVRALDEFEDGTAVRLFIFDAAAPERVLGTCSLTQVFRGPFHACYLGYALAAAAQGQGLMTEALQRVVQYAFDDMNLHRIMANYMPHNVRSGRLLKRLGFVVEGYARDYLCIAGRWEDHILTSITNARWRA